MREGMSLESNYRISRIGDIKKGEDKVEGQAEGIDSSSLIETLRDMFLHAAREARHTCFAGACRLLW